MIPLFAYIISGRDVDSKDFSIVTVGAPIQPLDALSSCRAFFAVKVIFCISFLCTFLVRVFQFIFYSD